MGVMGGLGIAQGLLGYGGNRQQAAQQNAYMAARQASEAKAIEAGYRMTLRQASERYSQERAAVARSNRYLVSPEKPSLCPNLVRLNEGFREPVSMRSLMTLSELN